MIDTASYERLVTGPLGDAYKTIADGYREAVGESMPRPADYGENAGYAVVRWDLGGRSVALLYEEGSLLSYRTLLVGPTGHAKAVLTWSGSLPIPAQAILYCVLEFFGKQPDPRPASKPARLRRLQLA